MLASQEIWVWQCI